MVLPGPLVPKFAICLDPGHGGRDRGARSGGLDEADLTLDIARRVRRILAPKYQVVLTRDGDAQISLSERVAISERAKADLFVSIHINAANNPKAGGYEVFERRESSAGSLLLAAGILVQFAKRWPTKRNRGLKYANFVVLRQARPACLVESFFLTNSAERALLASASGREQLGEAIAWGCGNFVTMVTGSEQL
ncbi:MAG: N-acetylmuramoyl-L-alanine amidase [bacterium]